MFFWFWTGEELFRSPWLIAPWVAFVATLMVSSIATFSWSSLRLRSHIRFEAIVIVVALSAALVSAPWHTLSFISLAYLLMMPFSIASYARVKRLRGTATADAAPAPSA
jgi:CDP-diacylglycerol--serine O-phosphatidyltransferase